MNDRQSSVQKDLIMQQQSMEQLEKNEGLICDSGLCPLGNLCETLRDLDFPDDPQLTFNNFCLRVSTSDVDSKVFDKRITCQEDALEVELELSKISDDENYVPQGTEKELVSLIGIKEETKN